MPNPEQLRISAAIMKQGKQITAVIEAITQVLLSKSVASKRHIGFDAGDKDDEARSKAD
jgi:hypothetical protein